MGNSFGNLSESSFGYELEDFLATCWANISLWIPQPIYLKFSSNILWKDLHYFVWKLNQNSYGKKFNYFPCYFLTIPSELLLVNFLMNKKKIFQEFLPFKLFFWYIFEYLLGQLFWKIPWKFFRSLDKNLTKIYHRLDSIIRSIDFYFTSDNLEKKINRHSIAYVKFIQLLFYLEHSLS